jgi:hypothetical protein
MYPYPQEENYDFWEVNQQNPMPALRALNLEDDLGAVDNYQPVIYNNEDDWGYEPVDNNPIIINNNNNAVVVENDWGDWAGEGQRAAVIAPPPSPDFQQN